MPWPPPKPARELAGQAIGPMFFSRSSLHVPVPSRLSVTPAGPYTLTCRIGEGTGPVVEPIVALPNALVGIPSALGEKPAWMMVTVSCARAADAVNGPAPQSSAATILARAMIALSPVAGGPQSAAVHVYKPSSVNNRPVRYAQHQQSPTHGHMRRAAGQPAKPGNSASGGASALGTCTVASL